MPEKKLVILFLLIKLSIVCSQTISGQPSGSSLSGNSNNFYSGIKDYDLGCLWIADSIAGEENENGSGAKVKNAEPLGYIDTNYQRFYIHFISATKKKDNPYEYMVLGKTRIKNTTCDFQGIIRVNSADISASEAIPGFREGNVYCEVMFYEDKKQIGSGFIKGKSSSGFVIDNKGNLHYNALGLVADGFDNNQFECTWTSYRTKRSKKCNWGDYRIPDSFNFDFGTGEFFPNPVYLKNGWEDFAKDGQRVEEKIWWK